MDVKDKKEIDNEKIDEILSLVRESNKLLKREKNIKKTKFWIYSILILAALIFIYIWFLENQATIIETLKDIFKFIDTVSAVAKTGKEVYGAFGAFID